MIFAPQNDKNIYKTLVEFGYAEYGSALEMLAAAKRAESSKLKIGYINHALDEYRHSALIFKVLDNELKKIKDFLKKNLNLPHKMFLQKATLTKMAF